MEKKIVVIGSGFASMAAATSLADKGLKVVVLEKNEQAGGRARQFEASGFTFDMGPKLVLDARRIRELFQKVRERDQTVLLNLIDWIHPTRSSLKTKNGIFQPALKRLKMTLRKEKREAPPNSKSF